MKMFLKQMILLTKGHSEKNSKGYKIFYKKKSINQKCVSLFVLGMCVAVDKKGVRNGFFRWLNRKHIFR